MLYLLLMLFPIAMAGSCFVLRQQPQLTGVIGITTALLELLMAAMLKTDQPSRLLGLTLTIDPLSQLCLLALIATTGLAFVVTLSISHGELFVPVTLIILALVSSIILLQQEPFTVALLLISAGVLAVLTIVDLPTGSSGLVARALIAAALKYLVLMVVAGVMMYIAFVLISVYDPDQPVTRVSPARLSLALLVVGFGIRLAIAPFHSWLPDLTEYAAPMVSVIIIAVINTVSLLFFLQSWENFPSLVIENQRGLTILMVLGIVTAIVGGFLAIGQESMRRTIGYMVVTNSGMIMFGIASGTAQGVAGALFDTFSQMLAILLLFSSIALLERPDGRPANVLRHDLLWRWPIAGTGLIGGGLTLLGLPPFSGFAGKLLLFEAAAERGAVYLICMLLAVLLTALALIRLFRERLFGPPEEQSQSEQAAMLGATDLDLPAERRLLPEPRSMALLTVTLLGCCLALGLYPGPLMNTIDTAVRGMAFLKFMNL